MPNFLKAYSNPDKHAVYVSTAKIIADLKVDEDGIQRYKNKIRCNSWI